MERTCTVENIPNAFLNTSFDDRSSSDLLSYEVRSFVGFVVLAVGLAGTLRIRNIAEVNKIRDDFAMLRLPAKEMLATHRPYLSKILNKCGSCQLFILNGSTPRGPIFLFASPAEAILFAEHIPGFLNQFAINAERVNRHIRLQRLRPHAVGSNVLIEFDLFYSDAVDQHVVTIALQTACYLFLQGNGAKELGAQGLVVTSELELIQKARSKKLKESQEIQVISCSGECLYAVWKVMGEIGVHDRQWGSIFNTTDAVAVFPACGHDPRSVAEFTWNHLTMNSSWEKMRSKISLLLLSQRELEPAPQNKRHSWSC
jgi:hypothetical protein